MKLNFQFRLSESQKSEWTRFWNNCQHSHPRQHYLFGEVERAKGRVPIYAAGEIDENLVCIAIFSICPLFFGKGFSLEAICLRGPAFDHLTHAKEFLLQITPRFKALNVGSIRISPYWVFPEASEVLSVLTELGFSPYVSGSNGRHPTGLVDIQRNKEEILASFSKWTRRDIRRMENFGVDIQPVKTMEEALLAFRCFDKMRHKRGLTPMSLSEFTKTFQDILKGQDHGILFNAFAREEFLGALWLIRGPQITHTAGFAIEVETCKRISNSLSVGPPLWWRGIQWAKEKGCSWLDVEGYSDNTSKSSPVYHIHEFKRKFRPKPVDVLSEHIYVCCPLIYAIYKAHSFFFRGVKFARSLSYQLKTRLLFWVGKNKSKQKS